jgi:hypothetical protein
VLGERIFGAALIAVGLFALYLRVELPFGTLREPGPGFFPVVVATALIAFSALALSGKAPEPYTSEAGHGGLLRVSILTAMIAAYGWLMPTAGFMLCTIGLLIVVLRLGAVAWVRTIISATVAAAACYLLFTRLGMPLPAGLLGF